MISSSVQSFIKKQCIDIFRIVSDPKHGRLKKSNKTKRFQIKNNTKINKKPYSDHVTGKKQNKTKNNIYCFSFIIIKLTPFMAT